MVGAKVLQKFGTVFSASNFLTEKSNKKALPRSARLCKLEF
jgi:hypothetical protein